MRILFIAPFSGVSLFFEDRQPTWWRCVLPCRPLPPSPRSTFKPGVSQHHHLLATRAAQRLTAETWVFGREPRCWSRLCSKLAASGPQFTAELTRSVTGPGEPGIFRRALLLGCTAPRERRVRVLLIEVYWACLTGEQTGHTGEPSELCVC